MTNYENELNQMCEEAAQRYREHIEIFKLHVSASIDEREIHPTDLDRMLTTYKDLIELTTLLKLYNKWFPHPVTQKAEKNLEGVLEEGKEDILKFVKRHVFK